MKTLSIAALLLFTIALVGCATTGSTTKAPLDPAQADVQVMIKGMSCPQCANNIKDIMERVDGVDQARVDLGAGRVLIAFTEGNPISEDELVLAVKDAGFTPGEVSYKNEKGGRQ
ncbi:MAG: heavy-metal-associated domain-containing protein [Phycisphaeraceae bacterium]|nr:heavy-metal-associated domain-containing protein [Phycisphaeraceae bacterium]